MVPGDGCVEETALARWRCVAASLGDGALRETVQGQIQCSTCSLSTRRVSLLVATCTCSRSNVPTPT
jgi:hypothetical protein